MIFYHLPFRCNCFYVYARVPVLPLTTLIRLTWIAIHAMNTITRTPAGRTKHNYNNNKNSTFHLVWWLDIGAGATIFDRNQISIRNIVHFIRCIISGKSFSLPAGTWTSDTKKRLLVLFCTTLALLFARFKVMGSQLPVFTRYVYIITYLVYSTKNTYTASFTIYYSFAFYLSIYLSVCLSI